MLLTRPPLGQKFNWPKPLSLKTPFDLHVLGTPPAFILSQDQTLKINFESHLALNYLLASHFGISEARSFLVVHCSIFKVFALLLVARCLSMLRWSIAVVKRKFFLFICPGVLISLRPSAAQPQRRYTLPAYPLFVISLFSLVRLIRAFYPPLSRFICLPPEFLGTISSTEHLSLTLAAAPQARARSSTSRS